MSDPPRSIKLRMLPVRFRFRLRSWSRDCGSYHASGSVVDIGTGAGALLPAIKRAAPSAVIVGVDRSQGMLRLAKDKHSGPLALMDVQNLALPANRFQVAVVAFVLFHLPYPEQCLAEVNRVLQRKGAVGTVTWGSENMPPANAIWDD